MSSSDALRLAKELTTRLGPRSSVQERRLFQEHLITLCSDPSYEAKAYFGIFVFRNFAEFEDLQDKAVDALLDLCEDEEERVRIIGIKGLGTTGKAEPRWVRGNTGVLLQLLECPPKELGHVRTSLLTLLSVSPADVLSVMADDCKGSEEETGASRRNILDFIEQQGKGFRHDTLDSGKNLAAEETFRIGFYDALGSCSDSEKLQILGMIGSISSVGGINSTLDLAGEYLDYLINSLTKNSPTSSTMLLVGLLVAFLKRRPPLDPRYILLFLASHGGAVVSRALDQEDKIALDLLENLKEGLEDRVKRFDDRQEGELSSNRVIPNFARTMIREVLSFDFSDLCKLPAVLENILYCVYRLVVHARCRRDLLSRSEEKKMLNFGDESDKMYRKESKESGPGRMWRNIRDIFEILGDPDERSTEIEPSWLRYPTRSTNVVPGPILEASVTATSTPGPMSAAAPPLLSRDSLSQIPVVRSSQPALPLFNAQVQATSSSAEDNLPTTTTAAHVTNSARNGPSTSGLSKSTLSSRVPVPSDANGSKHALTSVTRLANKSSGAFENSRSVPVPAITSQITPQLSPGSVVPASTPFRSLMDRISMGPAPLVPEALPTTNPTISLPRNPAQNPTMDPGPAITGSASFHSIRSRTTANVQPAPSSALPPSSTLPTNGATTATTSPNHANKSVSLTNRITSSSTSLSIKRSSEVLGDDMDGSSQVSSPMPNPRSLLSRLGTLPVLPEPEAKRIKLVSEREKPSLLSRMGTVEHRNGKESDTKNQIVTESPKLTSILGRAGTAVPSQPSQPQVSSQTTPLTIRSSSQPLNIRRVSTSSVITASSSSSSSKANAPSNLKIRNTSSDNPPVLVNQIEEEVIVRKGRGFRQPSPDSDLSVRGF